MRATLPAHFRAICVPCVLHYLPTSESYVYHECNITCPFQSYMCTMRATLPAHFSVVWVPCVQHHLPISVICIPCVQHYLPISEPYVYPCVLHYLPISESCVYHACNSLAHFRVICIPYVQHYLPISEPYVYHACYITCPYHCLTNFPPWHNDLLIIDASRSHSRHITLGRTPLDE
jgi:predicted DNA-binding transcriptional regulator AlpA